MPVKHGTAGLLLLLLLLQCSNGYQAPVTEQGETRVLQPPVIVTSDSSGATTSTRGAITSVSRNSTTARNVGNGGAVNRANVHRVRRGDTLYSVAFQYDLDFRSLAIANNLSPPYTIRVDQELNLDASNPVAATTTGFGSPQTPTGTVVSNNSVANARPASSTPVTVMRQAIGSIRNQEPQWRWPLSGRLLNGFQANDSAGKGIDIGGVSGQQVYAAADGDVVYAGNSIQGSGNLVIIRHSDRYLSAYAQNRSLLVAEGTQVRTGDPIAEVGQGSDGVPKLHFEIRLDGKPVDPLTYLPRQ
ncbi:MAG: peptidoglycan DD-metalloendopeptidase family protein [Pseudohongiellaceae bacterium]